MLVSGANFTLLVDFVTSIHVSVTNYELKKLVQVEFFPLHHFFKKIEFLVPPPGKEFFAAESHENLMEFSCHLYGISLQIKYT